MTSTLRARLDRIEKNRGNVIDRMTEAEIDARLSELMPLLRMDLENEGHSCDGLDNFQVFALAKKVDPTYLQERVG